MKPVPVDINNNYHYYNVNYICSSMPAASAPEWSLGDANFLNSIIYGNPAYFSFGISVNDKNSSEYIASVSVLL